MSQKLTGAVICVAVLVVAAFATTAWLTGERRPPWIWLGDERRPSWDDERARSFVGKYVLVGLTYEKRDGSAERQEQVHGRISAADAHKGFCVILEGVKKGQVYRLPSDLRPFKDAAPGEYRLRSTGEVVVDPDLLATWIVTDRKRAAVPAVVREC